MDGKFAAKKTLILGSVFNDYVVFYRDISLILLCAMRVQIRYF